MHANSLYPYRELFSQKPGFAFRLLAVWTALLLACPYLPAQSAGSGAGRPGDAPPARLQIQTVTTTPLKEPAGVLSAHNLHVRITDEWGMPVQGATVSFRLPEVGPGGVFLNGLSSEIAISDQRGEAAVQGFDWRAETGVTFIHVIAAYGAIRAGAMVEVHLERREPVAPRQQPPPVETISRQQESPTPDAAPPQTTKEAASESRIGRMAPAQSVSEPAPSEPKSESLPDRRTQAPRDYTPPAPKAGEQESANAKQAMVRVHRSSPAETEEPQQDGAAANSYIRVKRRSGGNKKLWMALVIAGAAGGAVAAAGLSGGGSSSSSGGGSVTPVIRIGSPSITISTSGAN